MNTHNIYFYGKVGIQFFALSPPHFIRGQNQFRQFSLESVSIPVNNFTSVSMLLFLQGPPPDPQYNFLSDRTRDKHRQPEKPEQKEKGEWNNREPPRRHPKNFGGSDFNNVKSKMKQVKDRQVFTCTIMRCRIGNYM